MNPHMASGVALLAVAVMTVVVAVIGVVQLTRTENDGYIVFVVFGMIFTMLFVGTGLYELLLGV